MKKIISIVLALTMLCAMIIPMTISASAADANTLLKSYADAKDGDKLIDLLFGQKSGAYQPHMFGNGTGDVHDLAYYHTSNAHVDVNKSGSTMTMINDDQDETGDQCGDLQYGAKIDGLKAGKDANGNSYKYTYAFQAKFQAEDCDSKHAGFYFCIGEDLVTYDYDHDNNAETPAKVITHIKDNSEGHLGAYGWWGHPYKSNGSTKMRYNTIRKDGATNVELDSSLSTEFKDAMKAGAGDWYDIVIEIDGYKMNISFNGTWLGWYDFTSANDASKPHLNPLNVVGESTDLAFITRLYNEDMTVSVKDVSIYKGIGIEIPEDSGDEEPTTPSKPAHPSLKLNVALWSDVNGGGKITADEIAAIKANFSKVLTDAGYDVSRVKINWTDLCADGGLGVERLVEATNAGDFDIVLGAGANAITKGLKADEANMAQMIASINAAKRRVVLIDDKNAPAAVLYEYVSTGKTTGYPAPPTGDNTTAIFFAIIAVVALGGTVVASKKRFN